MYHSILKRSFPLLPQMARLVLIIALAAIISLVASEADPKPAADPVADPLPVADPEANPEADPKATPFFGGGNKGSKKCYGKTHVIQKYITKYNKVRMRLQYEITVRQSIKIIVYKWISSLKHFIYSYRPIYD